MELIITIALVGFLNVACFIAGAKIAQVVSRGEKIGTPSLPNPIKAIQESIEERESKKAAKREQERIDTIMQNIESYDGTGRGQKDVSR